MNSTDMLKKQMEENERRHDVGKEIQLKCKHCGHYWYAGGYDELGGTFLYYEKDYFCSECDGEGEIL